MSRTADSRRSLDVLVSLGTIDGRPMLDVIDVPYDDDMPLRDMVARQVSA